MSLAIPRADGYFMTHFHHRLRKQVRDFAETQVRPRIAAMESTRHVEYELAELIAAQGWIGVTINPKYGGLGMGHLAKTVIIEELSRVSGAMGAMVQASQLGVAKIAHFGTESQKCRWLPAVSAGRCLPTIAVTELECGSNVLGMRATARREGDHFILNGRKAFVGNSHIGRLHGTVVRTGEGSRGLSAFLVESDRAGLSLTEHSPSMGLHGFSFGELIFDDCRVPVENMIGAEGDGLDVAYSSSVLYGRPNLAAVSLGIHGAIVELTVRFAENHVRYGKKLSELGEIKQKIGQMQSRLMTARLATYHAAHMLDEGLDCDAELFSAKLTNFEMARDSAHVAMEIHAAHGLAENSPIGRCLRDVWHMYAPAGTSDVQRLRLFEVAVGAYKGSWSRRFADDLRSSGAMLRRARSG